MGAGTPFNAARWLVDRHVEAGLGDNVAYWSGGQGLIYAGLQRSTLRAARLLAETGVRPGDRVLMVVCDEPDFPAVFLGAMRMGAIPIPASTMLRPEELAAICQDSGAVAVVVSKRFEGYLPVVADSPSVRATAVLGGPPWAALTEEATDAPASGETDHDTTETDPAFWLYTSGTTGTPKGAIHRHGDVRHVAETYARSVLRIAPSDVCYSVSKLFFAFGLGNSLLFPLSVGASAVIDPDPPTPPRVAALLGAHRPTLFFAPPGFCAALADSGIDDDAFASVRYTVTAGEALPAGLMRRFTARFGTEMLDGIGSTEALHIFCSNHPGDVRPGTSGRPVDGYELRLLDDTGREVTAPDTPGYLWVRGDSVADGYWQRPDITAATFVDGWLRTGDVYLRSADGYFTFYGRNSDMIKAGGIWVSPAEVESVLVEHPDVMEAAVVAGTDRDGLETVVAFVVARPGCTVDPGAIDAHCRERMASFKRPRQVRAVDALPKTATGKIKRYSLREMLAAEV